MMQHVDIVIEPCDPIGLTAQRLIAQLCAEMGDRYGQAPSPFSIAEGLKSRELFLTANVSGQPVGCGALRFIDSNTAEIKRMFVTPEWRRRGISRRIIEELERKGREFGYKSILLETGILQPEAQAAYASAGYKQIPNFGTYAGNPTSVCFQKNLCSEIPKKAAFEIKKDDLTGPEIAALLAEHLRCMYQNSPTCSVHALDLHKLRRPEITFYSVWRNGELAGCGALKELDPTHGEVKSMRTATSYLRQGVASAVLNHIIAQAKLRSYTQLSLETGAKDYFKPAHQLYHKFGFQPCEPFGDYQPDPNSMFFCLDL